MIKKYPIGTKIKYIGMCVYCKNKTGKIVKVSNDGCQITLQKSTCSYMKRVGKITVTWEDVVLAVKKNQQLLFLFMEE